MSYSPSFTATGITGARLLSRHAGATPGGAPTYGAFEVGDFVIDRSGDVWVCTVAGIPGTWASAGGSGVLTTEGDLLYENATPAPARLPIGSAAGSTGDFLGVSGGVPAWQQVSGQYLCAPSVYAPSGPVDLVVSTTTLAAFQVAATTVASGSNGGEISTIASWANPSAGVLDVAASTGFPPSGTLNVAASGSTTAVVTYTGLGAGTFTGCAYVSGSATGTVATGGAVSLASSSQPVLQTSSFTAPASGSVVVGASLAIQIATGGDKLTLGLAAAGTVTPVYGNVICVQQPNTASLSWFTFEFVVTGLTPGTSYQFQLVGATGAATSTIFAYGNTSTTQGSGGAPVTMTVQAV